MPSPFGTGEVVNRLRRLLDLRGRFGMQVDETVVPVALIGDGTQPPFRNSGRRWSGVASTTAVLAENHFVEILNLSGFDQVIDRIRVLGAVEFTIRLGPSLVAAPGVNVRTTERNPLPAGGGLNDVGLVVAIAMREGNGDPTSDVQVAQLQPDTGVKGVVEGLDQAIVLPPGASCFVRSLTTNVVINVSASGLFYDDVPRLGGA